MAFNISAQIVLSGPKNLNTVANKIKKGLSGINIQIDPSAAKTLTTINTKVNTLNKNFLKLNQTIGQVNSSLNNLGTNFNQVNTGINNNINTQSSLNNQTKATTQALKTQAGMVDHLNKRFSSAAKTAIAFGLISRPIYDLQRAFVGAIRGAVAFEKEIVKISQVTGDSVKNLGFLKDQINSLATSFGISANELAETATIIAQAGFNAQETSKALDALAKSRLTPTFGAITETTEGLIAALGQFNLTADQSEQILGSLNKVSKDFAVESADLIAAIRKSGGVFSQAAGGTKDTITALQELSAIFTAVRSTTRESADTIATGLRTIFSRIQRKGTIDFLKQFNIDLVDAQGKFVGIFPAFDMLSKRLDVLIKQGDALTISAIAEELGGIRQIGKLLPAIAQFDKARKALVSAQEGAVAGLSGDVGKALDTIDNRLGRVQERFNQLIRNVFESDAFQNFAKGILSSSENLLKFGNSLIDTFEPILPLLSSLGTIKIAGAIGGFFGGGGIQKAASTVTGQAGTQASQQNTATTQQNTTILQQNTTAIQGNTTAIQQLTRTMIAVQNQSTTLNNRLTNLIVTVDASINRLNQSINANTTAQNRPSGGFGPTSSRGPGGIGPKRKASGGKIYGFARGGLVPGEGNSDTVPAMLTPGEFVIKKSSVNKIGPETLAQMNNNKYAKGGIIALRPYDESLGKTQIEKSGTISLNDVKSKAKISKDPSISSIPNTAKYKDLRNLVQKESLDIQVYGESIGNAEIIDNTENIIKDQFIKLITSSAQSLAGYFGASIDPSKLTTRNIELFGIDGVIGNAFEGILASIGAPFDSGTDDDKRIAKANNEAAFDFPSGIGSLASKLKKPFLANVATDAKRTLSDKSILSVINTKYPNLLADQLKDLTGGIAGYKKVSLGNLQVDELRELLQEKFGGRRDVTLTEAQSVVSNIKASDLQTLGFVSPYKGKFSIPAKRASGSNGIGETDTVPALLTPGEFVINRDAAQRIGYGNLNRMNKQGVVGFNKGGTVGIQRFGNGGKTESSSLNTRVTNIKQIENVANEFVKSLTRLPKPINEVAKKLKYFVMSENQVFNRGTKHEMKASDIAGVARLRKGSVGINVKREDATVHTVQHEVVHHLDKALGESKGYQYSASQTEGTLQNQFAQTMIKTKAGGFNDTEHEMKIHEQFANKVPLLPKSIQKILLSTTDINEGMQLIDTEVKKLVSDGSFKRLPKPAKEILVAISDTAKQANQSKSVIKIFNESINNMKNKVNIASAKIGNAISSSGISLGGVFSGIKQGLTERFSKKRPTMVPEPEEGDPNFVGPVRPAVQQVLDMNKQQTVVDESQKKIGQSFGEMVGSVYLLQSTFDQYKQAMEDGTVSLSEMFNIALIAGPAFASLIPAVTQAVAGLKIFGKELISGGRTSLKRGTQLGGAGIGIVGAGIMASASQGDTTMQSIGGGLAAFGASVAMLPGPLGIVVGLLAALATGLSTWVDAGLKRLDTFPEALEDATKATDKLKENFDQLDLTKAVASLNDYIKSTDQISSKLALYSAKNGDLFSSFSNGFQKAMYGFASADMLSKAIKNLAIVTDATAEAIGKSISKIQVDRNSVTGKNFDIFRGLNLESVIPPELKGAAKNAAEANIRFQALKNGINDAANSAKDFKTKSNLNQLSTSIEEEIVEIVKGNLDAVTNGFAQFGTNIQMPAMNAIEGILNDTSLSFEELSVRLEYLRQVAISAGPEGERLAEKISKLMTDSLDEISKNSAPNFSEAIKLAEKNINDLISTLGKLASSFVNTIAILGSTIETGLSDIDNILSGSSMMNIGRSQLANIFSPDSGATEEQRQVAISQVGRNLGVDTRAIADTDKVLQRLPAFAEEFLKQAESGIIGELQGDTLSDEFIRQFKANNPGVQISNELQDSIRSSLLPGFDSRESDAATGTNKLREALESQNPLEELTGGFSEAYQQNIEKLISAEETRLKFLEQNINSQIKLDQALLDSKLSQLNAEEQNAEATARILKINRDSVKIARQNLNRRLTAVGATTSNVTELTRNRSTAIMQRERLEGRVARGEINPNTALPELQKLTSAITANTEGLKVLSDRTQELAAIEQEIAANEERRRNAEAGLEELIQTAASGDTGAQTELSKRLISLDKAMKGIATVPEAIAALDMIKSQAGSGLVNAIGGLRGAENLQSTLVNQLGSVVASQGGPIGEAAKILLNVSSTSQDQNRQLAIESAAVMAEQSIAQRELAANNLALAGAIQDLTVKDPFAESATVFKNAVEEFNNIIKGRPLPEVEVAAAAMNIGGTVNNQAGSLASARSLGSQIGVNFKPKGTDTVPAMLTPGEFVVQKSAVDRVGIGAMQALNDGNATITASKGGVIYRADGGPTDEERALATQEEKAFLSDPIKNSNISAIENFANILPRYGINTNINELLASTDLSRYTNFLPKDISSLEMLATNGNMINSYPFGGKSTDGSGRLVIKNSDWQSYLSQMSNKPEITQTEMLEFENKYAEILQKSIIEVLNDRYQNVLSGMSGIDTNELIKINEMEKKQVNNIKAKISKSPVGTYDKYYKQISQHLANGNTLEQYVQNSPDVRNLSKQLFNASKEKEAYLQQVADAEIDAQGYANIIVPYKNFPAGQAYINLKNKNAAGESGFISEAYNAILQSIDSSAKEFNEQDVMVFRPPWSEAFRDVRELNKIKLMRQQEEAAITTQGLDIARTQVGQYQQDVVMTQEENKKINEQNMAIQAAKAKVNADMQEKQKQAEQAQANTFAMEIDSLVKALINANPRLTYESTLPYIAADKINKSKSSVSPDIWSNVFSVLGMPSLNSKFITTETTGPSDPFDTTSVPISTRKFNDSAINEYIITGEENKSTVAAEIQRAQKLMQAANLAADVGIEEARKDPMFRQAEKERQYLLKEASAGTPKERREQRQQEIENARQAKRQQYEKEMEFRRSSRNPSRNIEDPFIRGEQQAPDVSKAELSLSEAIFQREYNALVQAGLAQSNVERLLLAEQTFRKFQELSDTDAPNKASIVDAIRQAKLGLFGDSEAYAPPQLRSSMTLPTYHTGGMINGRGDVPIMAQAGEYVMQKSAVAKYGVGTLERLNKGGLAKFHQGGPVYAAGGALMGKNTNSVGGSMSVDATAASKLLGDSLITAGNSIAEQWRTVFTEFQKNLSVALQPLTTVPEKIDATLTGPLAVEVNGGNAVGQAIANQVIPMIEKVLGGFMKLIPNTNTAGEPTDVK